MVTREKRDDDKGEKSEKVDDDDIYVYKERKRNIETTTRGINSPLCTNTHTQTNINTDHGIMIMLMWVWVRKREKERERRQQRE